MASIEWRDAQHDTASSEGMNSHFIPSDPGPSNYADRRSFGGGNSYGDHESSGQFDETHSHDYHNDFYPDDHRMSQGANLGRRNSRFILVGRIPSEFGSGIPHNVDAMDDGESGHWDEPSDEDEDEDANFINYSFLSNLAMLLRDKVSRDRHIKGRITYPNAFTGKDIVVSHTRMPCVFLKLID